MWQPLPADTKCDSRAIASWPYADAVAADDDALNRLCMVAEAVASAVLQLKINDAYNELAHRMHLIQIALNSWHKYEMDIPYRDTCWTLVDSMLRKISKTITA